MYIKKAAQSLIKKWKTPDEGVLNMIEMAFRAYDPCFSCATHSLPGNMPLTVNFRDMEGKYRKATPEEMKSDNPTA